MDMEHGFVVPLVIRGQVFEEPAVEFAGRRGVAKFTTPDIRKYLDQLVLTNPGAMEPVYRISLTEIQDFLAAVGDRLILDENPYLQEAFEISKMTSGLTEEILRFCYDSVGRMFQPGVTSEYVERTVGRRFLEGWVTSTLDGGDRVHVRAFGARTVHIVAGNGPLGGAQAIVRNALTRGDAIVKSPSNDPLTTAAIARTMIDLAPDHPITRRLAVAYWKGGDREVEEAIFQPGNIEKIVAWGGESSVTHVARYIRPGIDLITLDPKLSSAIVGDSAFADEATMKRVAARIAMDVGCLNQEACASARVVYVQSGTDDGGIARLAHLGEMVWEQIQLLPRHLSAPVARLNSELEEELSALRLTGDDYYRLIGGTNEGGVIVSTVDDPVDFARALSNRVVNLVPFDDLDVPVRSVTSYTQTIGVFPEALKKELRDRLSLQGAQRLVSLGHAIWASNHGVQDGLEPMRRMCRWIVDEEVGDERSAIVSSKPFG